MAQFKIIDRIGLDEPYRYIIQYQKDLVFGIIYSALAKDYKVGSMIDYGFLANRYDCLQYIDKNTGLIEYEEDVPF